MIGGDKSLSPIQGHSSFIVRLLGYQTVRSTMREYILYSLVGVLLLLPLVRGPPTEKFLTEGEIHSILGNAMRTEIEVDSVGAFCLGRDSQYLYSGCGDAYKFFSEYSSLMKADILGKVGRTQRDHEAVKKLFRNMTVGDMMQVELGIESIDDPHKSLKNQITDAFKFISKNTAVGDLHSATNGRPHSSLSRIYPSFSIFNDVQNTLYNITVADFFSFKDLSVTDWIDIVISELLKNNKTVVKDINIWLRFMNDLQLEKLGNLISKLVAKGELASCMNSFSEKQDFFVDISVPIKNSVAPKPILQALTGLEKPLSKPILSLLNMNDIIDLSKTLCDSSFGGSLIDFLTRQRRLQGDAFIREWVDKAGDVSSSWKILLDSRTDPALRNVTLSTLKVKAHTELMQLSVFHPGVLHLLENFNLITIAGLDNIIRSWINRPTETHILNIILQDMIDGNQVFGSRVLIEEKPFKHCIRHMIYEAEFAVKEVIGEERPRLMRKVILLKQFRKLLPPIDLEEFKTLAKESTSGSNNEKLLKLMDAFLLSDFEDIERIYPYMDIDLCSFVLHACMRISKALDGLLTISPFYYDVSSEELLKMYTERAKYIFDSLVDRGSDNHNVGSHVKKVEALNRHFTIDTAKDIILGHYASDITGISEPRKTFMQNIISILTADLTYKISSLGTR